jgi:hypothetical protein
LVQEKPGTWNLELETEPDPEKGILLRLSVFNRYGAIF